MDHMTVLELLLVSFPEAMLVAALGITLTGYRPRLKQLFIIGIFHALVSYIIRGSQVPFGLHTITLLLVFILVIHAVTRLNLMTSALAGLAGLTIFAALETLVFPQLLKLSGYTFGEVLTDPVMRIYFFLPEALILLLITLLCRHFGINLFYWKKQTGGPIIRRDENSPGEDFIIKQYFPLFALVLCPILLLALLNSAFYVSRTGNFPDSFLNVFTTSISLTVVVLTGLSAVAVKRITKVVEVEYQAKQTAETLSRMEELIYSIRKQRHDFNHHLQAVYGLLEVESYRKARDYIRKTFLSITTHGELIKTDNHEISAMLYTKIGLAEAKNINLEIIVKCSLKDLPLSSSEANSILGNLIDNAMDAVGNTIGERRLITVEITKEFNEFIFMVANRGKPISPEIINEIFKPHFSTKEGHQGLGLAIVKETVERFRGYVAVSSSDEETVFTVRIPSKR